MKVSTVDPRSKVKVLRLQCLS